MYYVKKPDAAIHNTQTKFKAVYGKPIVTSKQKCKCSFTTSYSFQLGLCNQRIDCLAPRIVVVFVNRHLTIQEADWPAEIDRKN